MLRLPTSHHTVYLVTRPIPVIGAQPGDELVSHPDAEDEDLRLLILRRLAPESTAAIPDSAVRFLAAYEPDSDVPLCQEPDEPARPALQLMP